MRSSAGATGPLPSTPRCPQGQLALKPANLTFEQAAISAFAALQALRDTEGVQPGQQVVIIGASGGVGSFAVQLGKAFGAEVTGVCSTKSVDMVRSIGADHVIDCTQEDFTRTGQRYDLILEMAGEPSAGRAPACAHPTGTLVLVGGSGGRWFMGTGRTLRAVLESPFVGQRLRSFLSKPKGADLVVLEELLEAERSPWSSTKPSPSARAVRRSGTSESGPPRGNRHHRMRGGAAVGFLYRGRRERPLTRIERRQLTVLAVATLVGLVVAIVGVVLLVPRGDRLGSLLVLTGTLIVSAAGFLSMRRLLPLRRRRFHAAMIAVIALL
jgi:Zinc-binding dehydrogenase